MFTMILKNKGLILLVALISIAVVLVPGGSVMAAGRGHGGGQGGGHWGGGWHGGWGWSGFGFGVAAGALLSYPYYSDAYYYPYGYAPIYRSATEVIVRESAYTHEPGYYEPARRYGARDTWYYCKESRAYYPYVRRCAGGWEKVPAVPPSSDPDDDR
ncbi:MAG: hypothetical protein WA610_12260 [Thermodesulfovibrionales bacterium]